MSNEASVLLWVPKTDMPKVLVHGPDRSQSYSSPSEKSSPNVRRLFSRASTTATSWAKSGSAPALSS